MSVDVRVCAYRDCGEPVEGNPRKLYHAEACQRAEAHAREYAKRLTAPKAAPAPALPVVVSVLSAPPKVWRPAAPGWGPSPVIPGYESEAS